MFPMFEFRYQAAAFAAERWRQRRGLWFWGEPTFEDVEYLRDEGRRQKLRMWAQRHADRQR